MDLEALTESIASVQRGSKWIVMADAAAGAASTVEGLRQRGALGVMVVAGTEGTGDLPPADRFHYTRPDGDTMMAGIRNFVASVERPSAELLGAVDAFDPDRTARVLGPGFSRKAALAGRPVFGARRPSWGALEDKTTVDSLWKAAGVPAAPAVVVPVSEASAAAQELSSDLGTVWVADNTEGWHGGGEYTKWVRSGHDEAEAVAWFTDHATTVRVMPFLEGLPCSIHAFITHDGVAVFDPVELYILRTIDPTGFLYARLGNFWTPPETLTTSMREAARSVAQHLRTTIGYLGGIGIDGVATSSGFLPTELNPRLSVGLSIQAAAAQVPLSDVERCIIEGTLTVDAVDLEHTIRDAVSTNRSGTFMFRTSDTVDDAEVRFVFDGDEAIEVEADAASDGWMRSGPAPFGSVIFVRMDSERTAVGPSTAPLALPLMRLATEVFGCELPTVESARDVLET